MDLHLYRHAWGWTGSLPDLVRRARAEGYRGIETPIWNLKPDQVSALGDALTEHGMAIIVQIHPGGFQGGSHRTVDADVTSFIEQAEAAVALKPVLINAHSGFDAWNRQDTLRFYRHIIGVERLLPVPVAHETHRGRCFGSPWAVRDLLPQIPEIRFTADFSHWCCVAERLVDDQWEVIQEVARRTIHLHARVGHSQGPQVPDPRHPRWADAVTAHERWWDLVWNAQADAGHPQTSLTPEFGPFPYLPAQDDPREASALLEDIIAWQADRQYSRFAAWRRARSA